MIVVGVDASLSCSGFAIAGPDGDGGHELLYVSSVKTEPLGPRPTVRERSIRVRSIVRAWHAVLDVADDRALSALVSTPLVAIESKDFTAPREQAGHAHDRAWLWGQLVDVAFGRAYDVVSIAPGTLKIYATGNGRASKEAVVEAVTQRYQSVANDDEADAVVLAAMTMDAMGYPLAAVPDTHTRTLDATRWPVSWRAATYPEGTTTP